jgi:thiamine pyridinylase
MSKKEFEKAHPDIDLVVRPISVLDNFYDLGLLTKWLKGTDAETYDIVEPDAILLGELIAAGVVQPWRNTPGKKDWNRVGAQAVVMNGVVYGIPHLLAGYFVVSRDKSVANATNITQFTKALRSLPNPRRDIVGNLVGSWTMPALYLDAWEDSHNGKSPAYALIRPLDQKALEGLRTLSDLCKKDGANPCLDGTFHNDQKPNLAAEVFARGEADAFFGYSEQLHYIMSAIKDDGNIYISSLLIGDGSFPILYTDAFVLRSGSDVRVEKAAEAFVAFMNSPRVQEAVMMSLDTLPRAKPRYLIPATSSAFDTKSVRNDRYYKEIQRALKKAVPFPSIGILNTRAAIRDEIKAFLEK